MRPLSVGRGFAGHLCGTPGAAGRRGRTGLPSDAVPETGTGNAAFQPEPAVAVAGGAAPAGRSGQEGGAGSLGAQTSSPRRELSLRADV